MIAPGNVGAFHSSCVIRIFRAREKLGVHFVITFLPSGLLKIQIFKIIT